MSRRNSQRDPKRKKPDPLDHARRHGWAIARKDLNEDEEAYARKLEAIGLMPVGFRRHTDASLGFGASPSWWPSRNPGASRARRSIKG